MIKDLSGVDQWHYMPTKSNLVDYISKGIDLTKLAEVKCSLKNPITLEIRINMAAQEWYIRS